MNQEFTLQQVVTLTKELAKLRNKSLPVKLGYALGKNLTVLAQEAEIVEDQRRMLCERYARKDEDGNPAIVDGVYDMTKENEIACNAEYLELLATTAKLAGIVKVPISVVEAVDAGDRYDALTMAELDTISYFIEG